MTLVLLFPCHCDFGCICACCLHPGVVALVLAEAWISLCVVVLLCATLQLVGPCSRWHCIL